MNFDEHDDPPVYLTVKETSVFSSKHLPEFSFVNRMCKVCYLKERNNTIFIHFVLLPSIKCIYILQLQRIVFKNGIPQLFIESVSGIW